MINDAQICLSGYVASEPVFRKHETGSSSARLRVAYTERRRDRESGEWADGPTTFVSVVCWRTLAENVAVCLRKGEPVMVRGRLQVRRFQNDEGAWRQTVEVDATSIGHDLNRGVAHFSRTRKAAGETAAEIAAGLAVTAPAEGGGAGTADAAGTGVADENGGHGLAPASAVVDEGAVAEFARELDESLSADPEPSLS
jgi:single-strand DNA-binding protein